MAEPKTRPTTASVAAYLAAQPTPERRADCEAIARMFERATQEKPVMWGNAIVGFGNAPVFYANGSSMDWPLMAFAPRAQDIVLYGLPSAENFPTRLAAIAPAKLKGSCVHIKRLRDLDATALEALIVAAVQGRRGKASGAAKPTPAKKAAAKKTPAKKTAAKKTPAKKAAAKKTPAKKAPAKKSPAKKAPANKSRAR